MKRKKKVVRHTIYFYIKRAYKTLMKDTLNKVKQLTINKP
jgi:hypothetical protein